MVKEISPSSAFRFHARACASAVPSKHCAHDQLYVAISRVRGWSDIVVLNYNSIRNMVARFLLSGWMYMETRVVRVKKHHLLSNLH
jgi:hypothetical protein